MDSHLRYARMNQDEYEAKQYENYPHVCTVCEDRFDSDYWGVEIDGHKFCRHCKGSPAIEYFMSQGLSACVIYNQILPTEISI